jgi:hypothetical protein
MFDFLSFSFVLSVFLCFMASDYLFGIFTFIVVRVQWIFIFFNTK